MDAVCPSVNHVSNVEWQEPFEWSLPTFVLAAVPAPLFHGTTRQFITVTCAVQPQATNTAPAIASPTVLGGTVRINLSSSKVIGIANSRGERA
jgi:hypothetical protein